MQKHNHIKALFFLGVFSVLLLHQVLPHWHHEGEVEHEHSDSHHGDTLGHHHHNSEKISSFIGFLDLLLDMHVHSVVSNDILLTHESRTKLLKVKKEISTPILINHCVIYINHNETDKLRVYQPPNNYFDSYLSSLDSRGPPSLG